MTERSHATPGVDARLAEFDRKLREIQAEIAPDRGPGVRAASPPPAAPVTELRGLLSSLHDVLRGIEAVLGRIPPEPLRAAASEPGGVSEDPLEATIAAGPFGSVGQVQEFERRLSQLAGVRGVTVRGYEGSARAIIDVQLGEDH